MAGDVLSKQFVSESIDTCDWHAWINLMPPGPPRLHVVGCVTVGNPGVDVFLTRKYPLGINHAILLLDLHMVQMPSIWIQMVTSKEVRYDQVILSQRYTHVEIFHNGNKITTITVEEVH